MMDSANNSSNHHQRYSDPLNKPLLPLSSSVIDVEDDSDVERDFTFKSSRGKQGGNAYAKNKERGSLTSKSRTGCVLFTLSVLFNVLAVFFIIGSGRSTVGLSSRFHLGNLGDAIGSWFNHGGAPSPTQTQNENKNKKPAKPDIKTCPSSAPLLATPPAPVNLWAPLSIREAYAIEAWLFHRDRNLNLTRIQHNSTIPPKTATLSTNIVYHIEAWYPAKEDALAYLDSVSSATRHNGSREMASPPPRYARVTIHHGGWKVPVIKDYLVGPLPLGPGASMKELKDIYHRDEIPFNAYGINYIEELSQFITDAVMPIAGIMEDLFNATLKGLPTDTLVAGMSGPFSYDGSFRRMWMTWRQNKAGSFLLPVGFYQYVDMSGTDTGEWKVLKILYHNQSFSGLEEFAEAYKNGTLVIIRDDSGKDKPVDDEEWTERKRIGPERDLDTLPGPRSVSFSGLRYRVDREKGYVSWMGWGMYLGFDRDMGMSLWDVRFRRERVLYQLAPQDALAQYGGNDPIQATTAWLDRYFGMGLSVRSMIPMYDCPPESVYLPASTYTASGTIHVEKAMCIFEQDTGRPLTRHFGWKKGEFGAVKSYVLTVRSISTVGNYDYHGTIEVRLSASGYMQGGYWNPSQDGYGGRIRHTSMGNLHDHVINYKVDFDIAGTSNSLLKITTAQEMVQHPWLDDDWGKTVIQQKITKEYIENEDQALLKFPTNYQGGYAVVNRDEKNKWGYPRGYAIHAGQSSVHNTVVGSKRLLNNANWARYNLAVSRRKETEPASSSMWNLNLPGAPMVDFHKFFDGENITQQDLVAWINLGMHHLPQAEDSPNTKTNVATSSFTLTPLNYFDYDISMELRNAILLQWPENEGDPVTFDDNGVRQDLTCLPEPPSPFEYSGVQSLVAAGSSRNGGDVELETGLSLKEIRRFSEMFLRMEVGGNRRA